MRLILAWIFVGLILSAVVLGISIWRGDASFGIGRLWPALAGPADQGPVAFASLTRRATPNDALVCPRGVCSAVPDITAPLYRMPAAELARRLRNVILATPDVTVVASGELSHRFVARTRWLRFPDTVEFVVIPRGPEASTLAIYSRSLVGRSDLGVNLGRIRTWLAHPDLAAATWPD